MANGQIQTLTRDGEPILPRTVSTAVTMDDGTSLEYAIKNIPVNSVKLPDEVLSALGLPVGTTLADFLVMYAQNVSNTVVAAVEVQ